MKFAYSLVWLIGVLCGAAKPCVAQGDGVAPGPVMQEMPGFAPPFWQAGTTQGGAPCDWALSQALVDVDGDADLDLVIAPTRSRQARLLLNDGHGRLSEVSTTAMPSSVADVFQVAAGDLDGDGDLDLVFANMGQVQGVQLFLFMSNGSGIFSDESVSRLPSLQVFPYNYNDSVAVADFDGDGDVDIVRSGGTYLTRYQYSAGLLKNDGTGHFTHDASAFPMDGGVRSGVQGSLVAIDMDGDGDMDLINNAVRGGMAYWVNDGSGHFQDGALTRVHPSSLQTVFLKLVAGDIDGDGDIDIVGSRAYTRDRPVVFVNNGAGDLTDVTNSHVLSQCVGGAALRLGDLDADGDLDIVTVVPPLGTAYLGEDSVLLNDGAGHFVIDADHRFFLPVPTGGALDLSLADMDGDGDVDAVLPNIGGEPSPPCRMRYYNNMVRHVFAPHPPTRGNVWGVVVRGPIGGHAWLAIAPRTGTVMIGAMGRLALDPATMVVLPGPVGLNAGGRASMGMYVPNSTSLLGLPVYVQAMVSDSLSRTVRLSNLWSEAGIR